MRKLKDVLRKYDSKSVVSFLREAETICAEQISLTQMGGVPQKKSEIDTEKKKMLLHFQKAKKDIETLLDNETKLAYKEKIDDVYHLAS